MSIMIDEQFMVAQHEGFVDAQTTCAQSRMKPMKTLPRCWWTTLWELGRHNFIRTWGRRKNVILIMFLEVHAKLYMVDEHGPSVKTLMLSL